MDMIIKNHFAKTYYPSYFICTLKTLVMCMNIDTKQVGLFSLWTKKDEMKTHIHLTSKQLSGYEIKYKTTLFDWKYTNDLYLSTLESANAEIKQFRSQIRLRIIYVNIFMFDLRQKIEVPSPI